MYTLPRESMKNHQGQNFNKRTEGPMDRKNNHKTGPSYIWVPVNGFGTPQQSPGSTFFEQSFLPIYLNDAFQGQPFPANIGRQWQQGQQRMSGDYANQVPAATTTAFNNSFAPVAPAVNNGAPTGPPPSNNNNSDERAAPSSNIMIPLTRTPEPMPLHYAIQNLTRHLNDVIQVCKGCLDQHDTDVERLTEYINNDCRNALWLTMLEARLKADDRSRHLFGNLAVDLRHSMRQVLNAANMHSSGKFEDGEEREWYERTKHEVGLLEKRCEWVITLSGKAKHVYRNCKLMVREMKEIVTAAEERILGQVGGHQDEDQGDNGRNSEGGSGGDGGDGGDIRQPFT